MHLACFATLLCAVAPLACSSAAGVGLDSGGLRRDASPEDGGAVVDAGGPTPSIEVGTGESSFEPLTEGGAVELHMGPQGGFHVFASQRLRGLALAEIRIRILVTRTGGATLSETELVQFADRFVREGDQWVHSGDLAILAIGASTDVVGSPITIRVEATDRSGRTASDERHVTVVDNL